VVRHLDFGLRDGGMLVSMGAHGIFIGSSI